MTGCERYTEAIGDDVDGALDGRARLELEEHLAGCPSCRALAADLRQIRDAARRLEPVEPPARVWTEISRRVAADAGARATAPIAPAHGRRSAFASWLSPAWQAGLAAAAVLALITVTASIVWLIERPGGTPPAPITAAAGVETAAPAGAPATAESVAGELKQAEDHYQKAIEGLQQIAKAGEGSLDPKVAESLQKNLAIVDQAIADSRTALQQQPTSEPAQASLLDAFRTKVGLLQETIALINEMRKGNQAGAARIMQDMKKS